MRIRFLAFVWFCLFLATSASFASIQEQKALGRAVTPRDPATLQVRIRTTEGEKPPSPVQLRLFQGDVLILETISDAMGNYTFDYLESGPYRVEANLSGFESTTEQVRLRTGGSRRVTIRLGGVEKQPFDPGSNRYWREAKPRVREEITKARQLRMTGDTEGAMSHIRAALELDPDFSVALGELGLCYMRLGQLDEARVSFEKTLDVGPESLTAYLNLAEIHRLQSDFTAAEEVLLRADEIHPDRAEPLFVQAKIQFEVGKVEEALASAHGAMERDTTYVPQIHLLLADIYEQRGELYRVPDELQAYLTKNPGGRDAEGVLARLESGRRELKSMEISLKRYTELAERYRTGQYVDAATAMSRLPRDVTRRAARYYQKDPLSDVELLSAAMLHTDAAMISGDQRSFHFLNATEYLRRIEDETLRLLAQRQWHLAVAYHFQNQQRFLVALPFLSQAARFNSEDIEVLLALGNTCEAAAWVYGYSNLLDRAEVVYGNVLIADPDNVEAHLRLGHVLKLKAAEEESKKELSWVLAHTEDPEIIMVANLLLGDIQRAANDLNGAIQCYRKAVEIDPDCQMATTAMSHAQHLAGDSVGSHQALRSLLENGSGDSSATTDGWWRYLLGRSEKTNKMMAQLRQGAIQ